MESPSFSGSQSPTSDGTSVPFDDEEDEYDWWRLSDEDVERVPEHTVLSQGGVFMLLYDCIDPTAVFVTDALHDGQDIDEKMAATMADAATGERSRDRAANVGVVSLEPPLVTPATPATPMSPDSALFPAHDAESTLVGEEEPSEAGFVLSPASRVSFTAPEHRVEDVGPATGRDSDD